VIEEVFRRGYGRLVAALVRRVGLQHLERIEDAVQSALVAALAGWSRQAVPDDPAAWLYRVACNRLVQELRQEAGRSRILAGAAEALRDQLGDPAAPETARFAAEIGDDLLRMLFVCCDPALPWQSQLVVALRTLCGFTTAEIGLRLFLSEANVHKRLSRARERLRQGGGGGALPPLDQLRDRLPGVQRALYLLFNEGYLSARDDQAIRRELCEEAVRLATLLAEHPVGAAPESSALVALMHLHAARLGARVDATGGLLLLEEQDRSRWDRDRIGLGARWLARSATGEVLSPFHAEAGIAAAHCFAPSFAETQWDEIAGLYRLLEQIAPSPVHTLNRAVAVAEWQGAAAGLAVLDGLAPPAWLEGSYLWDAVLGDLHRRAGHRERARQHRARALASAPTEAVRELLARRLAGG